MTLPLSAVGADNGPGSQQVPAGSHARRARGMAFATMSARAVMASSRQLRHVNLVHHLALRVTVGHLMLDGDDVPNAGSSNLMVAMPMLLSHATTRSGGHRLEVSAGLVVLYARAHLERSARNAVSSGLASGAAAVVLYSVKLGRDVVWTRVGLAPIAGTLGAAPCVGIEAGIDL